jgi:2-succinyl-5-enolpyruvyl-6-hydroxy-3-cyclohexene-1-carboxylate synthase
MHFDERGAAFFALGLARAKMRPVALICTSGSAVSNYLPAVVEAAASCIPLVLLTADRPPELLQTGANQAIEQPGVFAKYVRWETTLPCPTTDVPARFVLSTVDQACHLAMRPPAGPVHLNCMFREPLAPVAAGGPFDAYLHEIAGWRASSAPYTKYYPPRAFMDSEQQREVVNHAHFAKIGALIIGQLDDPLEINAARILAEAMPWPVLPDVLSGVRVGNGAEEIAAHYDQLLLSPRFRAVFNPDTVFHIGGAVTSKRLNEFLAERRPKYVYTASHGLRKDPNHLVTHRVECDLISFCGWLTAWVRGRGSKEL